MSEESELEKERREHAETRKALSELLLTLALSLILNGMLTLLLILQPLMSR